MHSEYDSNSACTCSAHTIVTRTIPARVIVCTLSGRAPAERGRVIKSGADAYEDCLPATPGSPRRMVLTPYSYEDDRASYAAKLHTPFCTGEERATTLNSSFDAVYNALFTTLFNPGDCGADLRAGNDRADRLGRWRAQREREVRHAAHRCEAGLPRGEQPRVSPT